MNITVKKIASYTDKETFVEIVSSMLADYCEKYKNNPVKPWSVDDTTFTIRDLYCFVDHCKVDEKAFSAEQVIQQLKSWQKANVFDLMIQGKDFEARTLMVEYVESNLFAWKLKILLVQFIGKNNIRKIVEKYADLLY